MLNDETPGPVELRRPMPPGRLSRLRCQVYERRRLSQALRLLSHGAVLLCVLALGLLLLLALWEEPWRAARLLLAAAVPFLLVTVLRHVWDLPRPYEVYSLYAIPPRQRRGRSFPSRHATSATVIATLALLERPELFWLWGSAALCAVLLCVCRVLLGVHFVRDVLAGALIGIAGGVLGALLIPACL